MTSKHWRFIHHVTLVERRELLELTLGVSWIHAFFQYGAGEPGALHLDELVDQHIAGRSQIAFEAESSAQQIRLAVSTAVREKREMQLNALDSVNLVFQCQGIFVIGERHNLVTRVQRVLECCQQSDACSIRHATRSPFARTLFAAALKGSSPTRLTVSMKCSCLMPALCLMAKYVERTDSMTSGTSGAEKDGPITLPGCAAPLVAEPSDPPSVTWYHSLPSDRKSP